MKKVNNKEKDISRGLFIIYYIVLVLIPFAAIYYFIVSIIKKNNNMLRISGFALITTLALVVILPKIINRFNYKEEVAEEVGTLIMKANDTKFVVELDNTIAASELIKEIGREQLELEFNDYGDFEKLAILPFNLSTSDKEITTKPGDIVLYQGNILTIHYGSNTWFYTKIGSIKDIEKYDFKKILGEGKVTIIFQVDE